MYKKILTFILALAMILCIVPISAFAETDQRIAVMDSEGVLLKPDDSRIKVDLSTNTLAIYGDGLTVIPDTTGEQSEIAIVPYECNLVIESKGTVTLSGGPYIEESGFPYNALHVNNFTQAKGNVVFDKDNAYEYYALYCERDFKMTGGTLTFKGTNVSGCVLRCANFSMSDGTLNINYPNCDCFEGIWVSLVDDEAGHFNMTGGTINIDVTENEEFAIYTSSFNMSGGKITAVSDFGISTTHTKLTGGEVNSTALNGSAFSISDGEVSNCVMTLNSNNDYGLFCGRFTRIEDEIQPIKIHDCKLSAIATGERSYGIISLPGLEFSNVDLYASGEMGAIVCANEPEYVFPDPFSEIDNLAGPFTFSDDMKLCGSNTFKDKAEDLEQAITMYESDLTYGSHVFNFRILSVDGTTPALTVVNNIYEMLEGAGQSWTKGSSDGLTFKSAADFDKFQSVLVDGKEVAKDNYTVKEGSTIVDLKAAFLETLSVGKHRIQIVSTNGYATADFTIVAPATPAPVPEPETIANTGEQSMLAFAAISTLSATAFYTSLALRKGREQS